MNVVSDQESRLALAAISATASTVASMSASVVNGPKLNRTVPPAWAVPSERVHGRGTVQTGSYLNPMRCVQAEGDFLGIIAIQHDADQWHALAGCRRSEQSANRRVNGKPSNKRPVNR